MEVEDILPPRSSSLKSGEEEEEKKLKTEKSPGKAKWKKPCNKPNLALLCQPERITLKMVRQGAFPLLSLGICQIPSKPFPEKKGL